jgi:hypothetical protein
VAAAAVFLAFLVSAFVCELGLYVKLLLSCLLMKHTLGPVLERKI